MKHHLHLPNQQIPSSVCTKWNLFDAVNEFALPPSLEQRAARLLEQQMWCLGHDIRHERNLLLEYGFSRERPPHGVRGSSTYRIEKEGLTLSLWGFGILAANRGMGTLAIKRHGFTPSWSSQELLTRDVWQAHDLPSLGTPTEKKEQWQAALLLEKTMSFMADYEAWIIKRCGERYRSSVIKRWTQKPLIGGQKMEAGWRELRKSYLEHCFYEKAVRQRALDGCYMKISNSRSASRTIVTKKSAEDMLLTTFRYFSAPLLSR